MTGNLFSKVEIKVRIIINALLDIQRSCVLKKFRVLRRRPTSEQMSVSALVKLFTG